MTLTSQQIDKDFCASSYLALRYVAAEKMGWKAGCVPSLEAAEVEQTIPVSTAADVRRNLSEILEREADDKSCLFLSGGIDSALLAALLPRRNQCYTIRFMAEGAIDETKMAAVYAQRYQLPLEVVEVTWQDYQELTGKLLAAKKAPLHAVEVALHKCAARARADGYTRAIVGNGADSNFGGLNKLLAKDWTFDEFVERYTFVDPESALKAPSSIRHVYEEFRQGEAIDVLGFLRKVHGRGITQAFDNALGTAGCGISTPYEYLELAVPLDLNKIRSGQSKYLLRELFDELYAGMEIPEKIPFARPMDRWLGDWPGPRRPEFISDLDMASFTGDQKWLLYCLERFLEANFA